MPDALQPLLVDRARAGQLLSVCPKTIDALIRAGELTKIKCGTKVLLDVADLKNWIERKKQNSAPPMKLAATA